MKEESLFDFPLPCPCHPLHFLCQDFLRGVFLVFLVFRSVWVRDCCCCGLTKPLETLYMILVCTNKLDLICLQLHHSYEACECLNRSSSLCPLCVSLSRHVPMICYYLFPPLLTKKVTWHLPSPCKLENTQNGFYRNRISGALIFASCVLFWL